jgi:hypothetical protein
MTAHLLFSTLEPLKLLNKYTINPQQLQQGKAFSLMSFHASPTETDMLALCLNNGSIKLIKLYNKAFKVSKSCGAQCSEPDGISSSF